MNPKLTEKLFNDFPNLYQGKDLSIRENLMPFGCEHGSGWAKLIFPLSKKLETLIVQYKKEYPEDKYPPMAVQVKEKYGSLRFYMTCESNKMSKLIRKAENKSYHTCEHCGRRGKIRGGGWLYCACPLHSKKRDRNFLDKIYYWFHTKILETTTVKIKGTPKDLPPFYLDIETD